MFLDSGTTLREITVRCPAVKTMIKITRAQGSDEATSVILLAAKILGTSHQLLEEKTHPTVIIQAYQQALEDAAINLRDNACKKSSLKMLLQ